jgi:hypothetical protein
MNCGLGLRVEAGLKRSSLVLRMAARAAGAQRAGLKPRPYINTTELRDFKRRLLVEIGVP